MDGLKFKYQRIFLILYLKLNFKILPETENFSKFWIKKNILFIYLFI